MFPFIKNKRVGSSKKLYCSEVNEKYSFPFSLISPSNTIRIFFTFGLFSTPAKRRYFFTGSGSNFRSASVITSADNGLFVSKFAFTCLRKVFSNWMLPHAATMATSIITFAMLPNFASFQTVKMSAWESSTATIPAMHQQSFFVINKITETVNSNAVSNHSMPIGFDISLVSWVILP